MTAAQIKDLHDRKAAVLGRRPAFARGWGQARVRLLDGFACQVQHEDRTDRVDLPATDGGANSGPHPGQLMRASIGACLAMGYRRWAAALGVTIDEVELEITCQFDARGQMGMDAEVPIGWQSLTVCLIITSAAPEEDVRRVVAHANRLSPMLANLSPALRQVHRLTVVRPTADRG